MLGKGCNLDAFHHAWVDLWSFEVSPKARHFLWRLCSNALPVRALLKFRHLIEDDSCPWGCGEVETSSHVLFDCPRVLDLWSACDCEAMRDWAASPTMCDLIVHWRSIDKEVRTRGIFLAWCIWGERNQRVFNNKTTPNPVLVDRVRRMVEEHGKYAGQIYPKPYLCIIPRPRRWVAPPADSTKINVDASLATVGWVGLGVVARNSAGHVLFSATRRVKAYWAPELAEAKAIAMALRLGKKYGLQNIVLESDCQVVINRLSKHVVFLSDLDTILYDILSACLSFPSILWSHVKRDGNFVAHHLAKLIPFGTEQIWENHCPPKVAPYVLMNNLSLD